ncbi:hypothetical protein Syun_010297 [Stephania yunnanensis]|uniref:Uncharacterized protein n=1 Tax=Stephania yunnanensis TaxID=152371 RepID=A0AAP0PPH8_9MAGN
MAAQGPQKGGARTAEEGRNSDQRLRGTDSGGAGPAAAVRDRQRRRGSFSTSRGEGCGGSAARVRLAAAQRRPTSGGDGGSGDRRGGGSGGRRGGGSGGRRGGGSGLERGHARLTSNLCGDGEETVQRLCGGSPAQAAAGLRRWRRRLGSENGNGFGAREVKMGLEGGNGL